MKQLNITVSESTLAELTALKLAFKRKHGRNITYIDIFAKLVHKAKLRDVSNEKENQVTVIINYFEGNKEEIEDVTSTEILKDYLKIVVCGTLMKNGNEIYIKHSEVRSITIRNVEQKNENNHNIHEQTRKIN